MIDCLVTGLIQGAYQEVSLVFPAVPRIGECLEIDGVVYVVKSVVYRPDTLSTGFSPLIAIGV